MRKQAEFPRCKMDMDLDKSFTLLQWIDFRR